MSVPSMIAFWRERLGISLRMRGFGGTFRLVARRVWGLLSTSAWADWRFDSSFGVSTAGRIGQYELTVEDPNVLCHAHEYRPTPVGEFVRILHSLQPDYRGWTFLDIGAGKGRAILLASHFPFEEVVGVEFAADLVEIARRNLLTYRNPRQECKRLRVVCQDAAEYEIPEGKLVVYLNNPFDGPVMDRLAANIDASIRRCPRDVYIVYWNPFCAATLDAKSTIERVKEGGAFVVYRSGCGFRGAT